MDYWPNVDAVTWFAKDMLPALRASWPQARFHIVGRNPAPAVRALASESINVTGTVPDVRPYLQHATKFSVHTNLFQDQYLRFPECLSEKETNLRIEVLIDLRVGKVYIQTVPLICTL